MRIRYLKNHLNDLNTSTSDALRLEAFEASSPGVGGGRGTVDGVPRGRPAVRSTDDAGVIVTELAVESRPAVALVTVWSSSMVVTCVRLLRVDMLLWMSASGW